MLINSPLEELTLKDTISGEAYAREKKFFLRNVYQARCRQSSLVYNQFALAKFVFFLLED